VWQLVWLASAVLWLHTFRETSLALALAYCVTGWQTRGG